MRTLPLCNRLFVLPLCLAVSMISAVAQNDPKGLQDEVIRIKTELVQTAVTVTDKKGKFVAGLRPDQFVLMVDGKPQTIRFVEHVTTGSAREAALTTGNFESEASSPAITRYRGRTIIFFVDDLHLSLQSLDRTRQAILHFIDEEMVLGDAVAIASASGLVGFLQQFTKNKEVLKAAVTRLVFRPNLARPMGMAGAPMSEYMAYVIDSRSDPKLTDVFIAECMKQTSIPKKNRAAAEAIRMTCETQVKSNARTVLLQSAATTQDTYNSLDNLLQTSSRMPGRKLTFFFSDGFLLDAGPRGADLIFRLQQVIDRAQRAGVVVYTVDAKGLVTTSLDATNNRVVDINGRLESATMREIAATQDALHALADETGGRALRNQNVFDRFVASVLKETSDYYLLAWRPETEDQKERKFRRVSIEIVGRRELQTRLPRGFFQGDKLKIAGKTDDAGKSEPEIAKSADSALRDALVDSLSKNSLPTILALNYLNTPANGMVVTTATQISTHLLNYGHDQKQTAAVDLAGVILNDKGKVATSFKKRLDIDPPAQGTSASTATVIYNHRTPLAPGIYQVRVAAREAKTNRIGSAQEWIVIPDLQTNQLALSSLLLGGQVLELPGSQASNQEAPQIQLSVDRRFARSSNLEFWLFIYNASRDRSNGSKPNLTVQVEVLRDGTPLATPRTRIVPVDGGSDLERIPYGGDLALKSLSAGNYELRVTVRDMVANKSITLRSEFEVE